MSARNQVNQVAPLKALALFWMPLALFWMPLSLFSQGAPPQSNPHPPQVQAWMTELQQIQARLEPLEEQALEDPVLQEQQQEVSKAVLAAMVELEPAVPAMLEQLREIMVEARQANGDSDRLTALAAEVQQLQPQIARVQALALARPEVEPQVSAFREKLYARMAEIDSETPRLLARFEELDRLIRQAIQG